MYDVHLAWLAESSEESYPLSLCTYVSSKDVHCPNYKKMECFMTFLFDFLYSAICLSVACRCRYLVSEFIRYTIHIHCNKFGHLTWWIVPKITVFYISTCNLWCINSYLYFGMPIFICQNEQVWKFIVHGVSFFPLHVMSLVHT